ncbi:MAG: MFS transporter [Steroidobacteraceae bacterium]
MLSRDEESATLKRVSLRLLPLLFGLYLMAFLDRVNVGIAALQMNGDLKFSPAVFGFGAGIFFLGYALCEVPSNLILARVGARRWLARIAISWGLLTCATMFVRTPIQFYCARLLLGVAEAGLYPGVIYYLGRWFPDNHRGRALSVFFAATPLAGVVGGPLGGALLGVSGVLGLAGWQWIFLVEGLPSVALGALVLVYLTERPSDAGWLSAPQRAWLAERIGNEHRRNGVLEISPLRALGKPLVWLLALPYFAFYTLAMAYSFWAPTIVRESLHTSYAKTGMVTGAIALIAAATYPLGGMLSDWSGERCRTAALALLLSAVGCVACGLLVHSPLRILGLVTMALAAGFYLPSFWCLPTRFLHGPSAAAGIALINALGSCGGFFGPSIIGFFRTLSGGDAAGFYALAGLGLLGTAVCAGVRFARTFRPAIEQPSAV